MKLINVITINTKNAILYTGMHKWYPDGRRLNSPRLTIRSTLSVRIGIEIKNEIITNLKNNINDHIHF